MTEGNKCESVGEKKMHLEKLLEVQIGKKT